MYHKERPVKKKVKKEVVKQSERSNWLKLQKEMDAEDDRMKKEQEQMKRRMEYE